LPLLKVIENIEGSTDYDVISSPEVREFKIYGRFEGDNWIQVLRRIINAYDTRLKMSIDEKNRKIEIVQRKATQK
jgi:hypothetical protein